MSCFVREALRRRQRAFSPPSKIKQQKEKNPTANFVLVLRSDDEWWLKADIDRRAHQHTYIVYDRSIRTHCVRHRIVSILNIFIESFCVLVCRLCLCNRFARLVRRLETIKIEIFFVLVVVHVSGRFTLVRFSVKEKCFFFFDLFMCSDRTECWLLVACHA